MLSRAEKAMIRESWELLSPVADTTAELLVQRLMQQEAALWPKSHAELVQRQREFLGLLSFVVNALDWDESAWRDDVRDEQDLFVAMLGMGERNTPLARLILEHYPLVGDALVESLATTLGKRFDPRTKAAWSRLYALLANALRLGQLAARVRAVPEASAPVRSVIGSVALRRQGVAS